MQDAKTKNEKKNKSGYHLEEETWIVDLVCGMELKLGEEVFQEEYNGKTYYFCSENCKEHFAANPQKYA